MVSILVRYGSWTDSYCWRTTSRYGYFCKVCSVPGFSTSRITGSLGSPTSARQAVTIVLKFFPHCFAVFLSSPSWPQGCHFSMLLPLFPQGIRPTLTFGYFAVNASAIASAGPTPGCSSRVNLTIITIDGLSRQFPNIGIGEIPDARPVHGKAHRQHSHIAGAGHVDWPAKAIR